MHWYIAIIEATIRCYFFVKYSENLRIIRTIIINYLMIMRRDSTCFPPSSSLLSRMVEAMLGLGGCIFGLSMSPLPGSAGCIGFVGCVAASDWIPSSWSPGAGCKEASFAEGKSFSSETATEPSISCPASETNDARLAQLTRLVLSAWLIWLFASDCLGGSVSDLEVKAGWIELPLMLFARRSVGHPCAAFHKVSVEAVKLLLGHTSEATSPKTSLITSSDASLSNDNKTCFSLSSLQILPCKTAKRSRTLAVQTHNWSGSVGLGKVCNNEGWMFTALSFRAAFRFGMSAGSGGHSLVSPLTSCIAWKHVQTLRELFTCYMHLSIYLYVQRKHKAQVEYQVAAPNLFLSMVIVHIGVSARN